MGFECFEYISDLPCGRDGIVLATGRSGSTGAGRGGGARGIPEVAAFDPEKPLTDAAPRQSQQRLLLDKLAIGAS